MMQMYYGKYRGIVRDHHDPKMLGRIRAEVPFPLGTGAEHWSLWAWPCFQAGQFFVPEEGDGVWIEFENGDPGKPLWSGIWYKGQGATTEAPFQATHAALTDFDGNNVETDTGHDDVMEAQHKLFHQHPDYYTPHRFGVETHTGHQLEFVDHPGKEAQVRLQDRFGRWLRMTGRGLLELVSHTISAVTGQWQDLNGANVDGRHYLVFADFLNDASGYPAGQYAELGDMAGATLRLQSTPGAEFARLRDFWDQYLRINSVSGQEYIELHDKNNQRMKFDPVAGYIEIIDRDGQKMKFDAAAGTVRVDDENGNYILMANGKITVSVPAAAHVYIGGESGQEVATKAFVQQFYNTHTHLSAAPGAPTSPPVVLSPLTPSLDITKKQLSE